MSDKEIVGIEQSGPGELGQVFADACAAPAARIRIRLRGPDVKIERNAQWWRKMMLTYYDNLEHVEESEDEVLFDVSEPVSARNSAAAPSLSGY